jgi:hypothetical protein
LKNTKFQISEKRKGVECQLQDWEHFWLIKVQTSVDGNTTKLHGLVYLHVKPVISYLIKEVARLEKPGCKMAWR